MKWWHWTLLVAVLVAGLLSPFASSWPDGLERVAEFPGFGARAEGGPALHTPMPDYLFPGLTSERLATITAGVLGTLLVFAMLCGLGWLLARRAVADDAQP